MFGIVISLFPERTFYDRTSSSMAGLSPEVAKTIKFIFFDANATICGSLLMGSALPSEIQIEINGFSSKTFPLKGAAF